MAKLLRLRRGTTTQHGSFTGAEGEVTVDTDKDTLVVHDNATAGGRPLLREDLNNMPASGVTAGTYGSASAIPAITVDAKGRVTSATTSAIDSTSISNGTSNVSVASGGDITVTRAGSTKATFNSAGADIPGTLTANNLVVDDDGGGDPTVMIRADDAAPYALIVRNDTYSTAANTGFGVIQANAGDVSLDFRGNAEFKNVRFRQSDNSTTTEFIHVDTNRAVHVKHDGSNKLSTTSTGINVTGSVTCDGLQCDGDARIESGGGILKLRDTNDTGAANVNYVLGEDSAGTTKWRVGHLSTAHQGLYLFNDSNGSVRIGTNGITRVQVTNTAIQPDVNNDIDLGTSTYQFKNAYIDGTVHCDGLQCDGSATINAADGYLYIIDSDNDGIAARSAVFGRDYNGNNDWYVGQTSASNNNIRLFNDNNANIEFGTNAGVKVVLQNDGHFRPDANNAFDLGTSSYRWRNVYTNDLNLSNEGGANDVDGSWGSWTIQEGEDDLFLLNRRNGKKYKFNLSEVN